MNKPSNDTCGNFTCLLCEYPVTTAVRVLGLLPDSLVAVWVTGLVLGVDAAPKEGEWQRQLPVPAASVDGRTFLKTSLYSLQGKLLVGIACFEMVPGSLLAGIQFQTVTADLRWF